jgi:hypothetical protein
MERRVSLGSWGADQMYEPTSTGGRCSGSCHPTKCYDREVPVDLDVPVYLPAGSTTAALPPAAKDMQ